jgi:hypothetical protein
MAWTIDKALDDDLIHLENRNDDLGVYEFRVGELDTIVSVDIGRLPSSDEAKYHRSHNIKTPKQAGPHRQSRPYWDDIPYALHQAISGITSHYRDAVKAGHKPDESWLVRS